MLGTWQFGHFVTLGKMTFWTYCHHGHNIFWAFYHSGHFVILGLNVIWAFWLWAICHTWAFCHLGHFNIQSEIRITRVCTHFFSIKTFYNKKWTIVCKRTDHPYCICAFLNESFAISKVYHYTYARMLWTQFLLYYWAAEKWTTQKIFVCHSVFTH